MLGRLKAFGRAFSKVEKSGLKSIPMVDTTTRTRLLNFLTILGMLGIDI